MGPGSSSLFICSGFFSELLCVNYIPRANGDKAYFVVGNYLRNSCVKKVPYHLDDDLIILISNILLYGTFCEKGI